jgi:hypothetical protein
MPLIKKLSNISKVYNIYTDDILKVAENEMILVESIQRESKPSTFNSIVDFDNNNELLVSAIGLSLNLLQIHSEMKNKNIIVSNLKEYINIEYQKEDNIKNARIVASRFFDRIDKYYNDRKVSI